MKLAGSDYYVLLKDTLTEPPECSSNWPSCHNMVSQTLLLLLLQYAAMLFSSRLSPPKPPLPLYMVWSSRALLPWWDTPFPLFLPLSVVHNSLGVWKCPGGNTWQSVDPPVSRQSGLEDLACLTLTPGPCGGGTMKMTTRARLFQMFFLSQIFPLVYQKFAQ